MRRQERCGMPGGFAVHEWEARNMAARTGEPPKITVRPSIGISSPIRYHAFLTDGVLQAFPLTAREAEDVATKASRETGIPCSVVQVRPGALVVMDTSVALRHDLMIL